MVKFLREYWFGILMSVLVALCLLFTVIVAVAPHNDAKMRGFTPCTYRMAEEFGNTAQPDFKMLLNVVSHGYVCYFLVIKQGITQYFTGKQSTPWSNYFFEPVVIEEEKGEAFSQELMDANLLDDENEEKDNTLFGSLQENDDEK